MAVPALNKQPPTEAPAQWLAQHGDMLFRYALARVRSQDAAEELVQETLLAGLRGFAKFDRRSTVSTWLTGILKHKIMDYIAQRARQPEQIGKLPDDDFFNGRGKWKNPPKDWEVDPAQLMEQAELRVILNQCLDKLPRRMAELFLLHQSNETTTEEICKATSLTPTNIWSILYRTRLRLRECLAKNWFEQDERETK